MWNKSLKERQGYLYVEEVFGGEYMLSFDKGSNDGNFYLESDLTLYEEPKVAIRSNPNKKIFTIETQPHYKTKLYTYEDGSSDISNVFSNNETQRVIFNGRATVVILNDGSKGVSVCGYDDAFDEKKGYKIALRRAYINQLNDELKDLTK